MMKTPRTPVLDATTAPAPLAARSPQAPPAARVTEYDGGTRATVLAHLDEVAPALESLRSSAGTLARWGAVLAAKLSAGHRLLVAGNGGSAAEAQHLTAELVGRFDGERGAYSAISLHAETSALTAISNDYGYEKAFSRQVSAHGRDGDVLLLLSTSGSSENLLHAARTARSAGLETWALLGTADCALARLCDDLVAIEGPSANVQECHLMAVHALCRVFDAEVRSMTGDGMTGGGMTGDGIAGGTTGDLAGNGVAGDGGWRA